MRIRKANYGCLPRNASSYMHVKSKRILVYSCFHYNDLGLWNVSLLAKIIAAKRLAYNGILTRGIFFLQIILSKCMYVVPRYYKYIVPKYYRYIVPKYYKYVVSKYYKYVVPKYYKLKSIHYQASDKSFSMQ